MGSEMLVIMDHEASPDHEFVACNQRRNTFAKRNWWFDVTALAARFPVPPDGCDRLVKWARRSLARFLPK